VNDSHTHLDSCAPPNAELVAAAARDGVDRILTVGMDSATNRTALQAAEDFPQVHAAVGRHPNHAEGFDDADLADLQALAGHPRCAAVGETGLDYFRDHAPRADQKRAFHAQIELAQATGKPLVIHTRAAEDDTLATLKARAHGLPYVELTTNPDNIPSQRVILANGGRLVERFRKAAAYGEDEALRFRIDL